MENHHILVSGAGSGLGKHLCHHFNGIGFLRETSLTNMMTRANQKPFDVIIHAAFNAKHDATSANLSAYLNDTILLTQQLLTLPHRAFIFVSSCDVYPKNADVHQEEDNIQLKEVDSIYGIAKLMSESLVQEKAANPLILRPTALLGQYARKNSLSKLLMEKNASLTLSEKSVFNYILHADVTDFIEKALNLQLTGIYNLASSKNVSLGEVAQLYNRTVNFGSYTYHTGQINNTKAIAVLSQFAKTSLDNITTYQTQYCADIYE